MKLKTIAAILGALAVLYGCGTSQRALGRTESQRETVKVIEHTEYVPVTVNVPIPEITSEVTVIDTSSHLENKYSESDARINSDGTLYHNLKTKPQNITATAEAKVQYRDSIIVQRIESEIIIEKPVEKKLGWWQRFRMSSFWVLLSLLVFSYRRAIWAIVKIFV